MKPRHTIARWIRGIANRFEGAHTDVSRSSIPGALQGARFEAPAWTRRELVRRARYFERNSALVNRLADLFEAYTVGGGLVYQPASSDEKWNRKAKEFWDYWAQLPDASSRMTLGTLESLSARTWFIDGEAFIHKTFGDSKPKRARIQLFESHLVKSPSGAENSKTLWDGVGLNPGTGRPISYYVGSEDFSGNVFEPKPVEADHIIHLWEPSRPQQVRGLTYLYPILHLLHDLDDLQILEMRVAKQAGRVGIKRRTESGALDPDDFVRNGTVGGAEEDPARAEYYRKAFGGEEVVLQGDDDVVQFRNDRPSIVTMEYWRHLQSQVCAGVGIPYVLAFPESMQGTVYRGALDMAHAWFMARHQVIAGAFRQVYRHVMDQARFSEPTLRDPPADWARVRIHPPKACNVDVGRNSNALLAELAAGITTLSSIAGKNGEDWREVLAQRKAEQAEVERLGLKLQIGQVPSQAAADQQKSGTAEGDEDVEDDKPEPMRKAA